MTVYGIDTPEPPFDILLRLELANALEPIVLRAISSPYEAVVRLRQFSKADAPIDVRPLPSVIDDTFDPLNELSPILRILLGRSTVLTLVVPEKASSHIFAIAA